MISSAQKTSVRVLYGTPVGQPSSRLKSDSVGNTVVSMALGVSGGAGGGRDNRDIGGGSC